MQQYNVKVNLIPDLPTTNFRNGRGSYEGVVCHCTDSGRGDGSDTPTSERNYESKTFNNAFVHFFVGVENNQPIILQVASTDYQAYGAGPKANPRFIHVELCMYNDEAKFKMAYDAYCFVLAKILYSRKLGVSMATKDGTGTVWAHKDITTFLGGTTHEDPIAYLAKHNITWAQHVQNIKNYYNFISGNTTHPIIGKATVTADVLNIRSGPGTNYSIVATAKKGEVYSVYSKANDFYCIGTNKYFSSKYCTYK